MILFSCVSQLPVFIFIINIISAVNQNLTAYIFICYISIKDIEKDANLAIFSTNNPICIYKPKPNRNSQMFLIKSGWLLWGFDPQKIRVNHGL